MAEQTVELTYHGPPVFVVESQGEVRDGDKIEVDKDLAARLLVASGFSGGPKSIQPPKPLAPPPPTGARLDEDPAAPAEPSTEPPSEEDKS
jgi:hypothetical protein